MHGISAFFIHCVNRNGGGVKYPLITAGRSHVEGPSPHHPLACSRRAQLLGLDCAANIGCRKPAVQTNRLTHSDKNHNDSKGSKVVTDKSGEFYSDPATKDTAAEKQAAC